MFDKGFGKGNGKKGNVMNVLVDVFKAVGLQMPPVSEQNAGTGVYDIIRPKCCFTNVRNEASAR